MTDTTVLVAGSTAARTYRRLADAEAAAARLRGAGFSDIRLSERSGKTTAAHVPPDAGATETDFSAKLAGAGFAPDAAAEMTRAVAAGGVLLTILAGTRVADAAAVLRGERVASIAMSPVAASAPAPNTADVVADSVAPPPAGTTPAGAPSIGEDRVIPLHAERLDIAKERETREARVRKEVVTEQQVISVPVQREQLVIERDGEKPVRIPLHEIPTGGTAVERGRPNGA